MGVQNTGQNITASLTPPLLGGLIAVTGFGTGFAVVAVFPILAMLAIPVAAETGHRALPNPLRDREPALPG